MPCLIPHGRRPLKSSFNGCSAEMEERFQKHTFLLLLLLVSLSFFLVLKPFYEPIFWAAVIAIISFPIQRRLEGKLKHHHNLSALLTLLFCVTLIIIPVLFVLFTLAQEGVAFYQRLEAGQIDIAGFLEKLKEFFPRLQVLFGRLGLDFENLNTRLAEMAMAGGSFLATQLVAIGQNTIKLIIDLILIVYLLFFFLRDGRQLVEVIVRAMPLGDARERLLFIKFSEMTRATVKGSLLVAMVQGLLGGMIFWVLGVGGAVLWGVVMALLSLLPALGAALIWFPAAVYLVVSGSVWQGIVLALFGLGVISTVDNILRPILVGRDTKLPDYLVLLSTLGGLWLFGLTGFMLGPLVAALFVAFWGIFMREFNA
jgi:predicted PurR-regulated permease PerM